MTFATRHALVKINGAPDQLELGRGAHAGREGALEVVFAANPHDPPKSPEQFSLLPSNGTSGGETCHSVSERQGNLERRCACGAANRRGGPASPAGPPPVCGAGPDRGRAAVWFVFGGGGGWMLGMALCPACRQPTNGPHGNSGERVGAPAPANTVHPGQNIWTNLRQPRGFPLAQIPTHPFGPASRPKPTLGWASSGVG